MDGNHHGLMTSTKDCVVLNQNFAIFLNELDLVSMDLGDLGLLLELFTLNMWVSVCMEAIIVWDCGRWNFMLTPQ